MSYENENPWRSSRNVDEKIRQLIYDSKKEIRKIKEEYDIAAKNKELGYNTLANSLSAMLIDVKTSFNMTGLEAEKILDSINITVNKTIPTAIDELIETNQIIISTKKLPATGAVKLTIPI